MFPLYCDLRPSFNISNLRHHDPFRVSMKPYVPQVKAPNPPRALHHGLVAEKPSACTADELHYVDLPNSHWKLALWRYKPSSKAPLRNHPLLLLSGVGTNALGYDLAPKSSFARHMSSQGYDTWILELRGAGLSAQGGKFTDAEGSATAVDELEDPVTEVGTNGVSSSGNSAASYAFRSPHDKWRGMIESKYSKPPQSKLEETFELLSERFSTFLKEGPLDATQSSTIMSHFKDMNQKLVGILEAGQRSVSLPFFDLKGNLSSIINDFQKQVDLVYKYDWDFDHYLEEDVPSAMDYIRRQSKPKDGKLLAIGHSMGGILLYAMLSKYGFEGKSCELASVVTLGSSLDYTTSRSSLKMLLPLVDPLQALNVPVIPLGILFAAVHPFASQPPYLLSWMKALVSAQDMMHPELLERLTLNNFCTIPTKLLLQLATVLYQGGLSDRSRTFFYKDHIYKSNVPVLAIAGDEDLICPPEAVYETAKLIPKRLITYKVYGEPGGPHYGHYDLVGGIQAVHEVYPSIIKFLNCNDGI